MSSRQSSNKIHFRTDLFTDSARPPFLIHIFIIRWSEKYRPNGRTASPRSVKKNTGMGQKDVPRFLQGKKATCLLVFLPSRARLSISLETQPKENTRKPRYLISHGSHRTKLLLLSPLRSNNATTGREERGVSIGLGQTRGTGTHPSLQIHYEKKR